MTAARPIQLLSCCARYASVILPAYSVEPGEQPTFDPKDRMFECICGLSAEQVLDECDLSVADRADERRQGGSSVVYRIGSRESGDGRDTGAKAGELVSA